MTHQDEKIMPRGAASQILHEQNAHDESEEEESGSAVSQPR
jgi:hypothetical protein